MARVNRNPRVDSGAHPSGFRGDMSGLLLNLHLPIHQHRHHPIAQFRQRLGFFDDSGFLLLDI
jgi:hypothetical protein